MRQTFIDLKDIDITAVSDRKLQAILICLFTDAYIEPDELPQGVLNRGWWGDSIELKIGDKKESLIWGSKLWLMARSKLNDAVLRDVKTWVKQALAVLTDNGFIQEPEILVQREGTDCLTLCLNFVDEQIEITGI